MHKFAKMMEMVVATIAALPFVAAAAFTIAGADLSRTPLSPSTSRAAAWKRVRGGA